MKIRLTMQDIFLSVDVREDKAVSVFCKTLEKLFLYAGQSKKTPADETEQDEDLTKLMKRLMDARREGEQQEEKQQEPQKQEQTQEESQKPQENPWKPMEQQKPTVQQAPKELSKEPENEKAARRPEDVKEYKGFLLIRCKQCGYEKAYGSKYYVTFHKCPECGFKTELQDLRTLWLNCQCGNRSRYNTNIMDEFAETTCVKCGAPVPTMWNAKKKCYQTIKE